MRSLACLSCASSVIGEQCSSRADVGDLIPHPGSAEKQLYVRHCAGTWGHRAGETLSLPSQNLFFFDPQHTHAHTQTRTQTHARTPCPSLLQLLSSSSPLLFLPLMFTSLPGLPSSWPPGSAQCW